MPPTPRTLTSALLGLVLAGSLLVGAAPRADVQDDVEPAGFAASCIGYCKHPTNAAKVFRWGVEDWRQEFERGGFKRRHWSSNHPGLIGQQHGMFTLHAKPRTDRLVATARTQKARYGRWEARVRAVELTHDHHHYRFWWELTPAGASHCTKGIVLSTYKPGASTKARGEVRNGGHQFSFARKRDLRSRAWHTYAVEVRKKRISWFVDTKVIRTERRDAATSGVKLKPRFRIERHGPGKQNDSWMQMDWVRYYTLHRPNAHSVKAPQMHKSRTRGAC